MSKITYTTEILYHFNCTCGGWWTIGDLSIANLGLSLNCPYCGIRADVEPVNKGTALQQGVSAVTGGIAAMALKRAISQGKTIEIPSLGIKIEPDNPTSQNNP